MSGAAGPERSETCILCDIDAPGRNSLVLVRGGLSYVVLNLYPYNSGHVMVASNRHVGTLAALNTDERTELMHFTRHAEMALTEAYAPHGINVGINLGRPAGAGVVDHVHIHLVPRWNGDTSFMSVVGNTRVLPEDLAGTAGRLQPIFERLAREDAPHTGGLATNASRHEE